MKKFAKIVGILLCLAMVLSILPASIIGAIGTDASAQAATETKVTGLGTPTFGYYTNNNTDGAITEYYNNSYGPANLVDGKTDTNTRSLYYRYDEVNTGVKIPVVLFNLGAEMNISAVEVDTYKATYYGIDNFTIQVYTANGWKTVKEVTGAFSGATHGDAVAPEKYDFEATAGTKVRILVTKLSDMSSYAEEDPDDAELAEGSYIRLREVTLYETDVVSSGPVETVRQKIDLSGCMIGACSSPYNASASYKDQNWYSARKPGWKDLGIIVDGNYNNEVTFGVDPDERGDFYVDLTKKYSAGVSADELILYYGLGGESTSMPTVTFVLELVDGTSVEKNFTTNWSGLNAADPLVWKFGETYDIKGVYVWSPSAPKVSFAELELYSGTADDSTTDPEPDVEDVFADLEQLDAPVPVVGYYSNNNTDGDITNHSHATHTPANMVDGDVTNQSRSGYFTHAEIADGTKIPVILFTFEDAATVGGIEIFGYQAKRYNMEDFDIQVSVGGKWTTVATVEDAFRDQGDFGNDLTESLKVVFDDTYTADALRILVKGISDMTADAEDDAESAELLTGGYIRVREIKLYGLETAGKYLETAKLNGVDIGEYVIVYSDAEPDYNITAAEYIQSQILKKTGRVVTIVEDDTAETANEILVGNTNRSLSTTLTSPGMEMKFNLQASGTKIAMEADYFIIAGAAYYFIETYVDSEDFENNVPTNLQTLAPITKKANNYIILIGDGMGVMQTKLFDKYGASPTTGTYGYGDGEDVFYGYYLPYQGFSKTANVFGTVTDSAAGGTALATGYKTVNGYVGKDKNLKDIKNMSELAWEMGKSVGIMSTEGSDGATPSSFSAHASGRYDDEIITDQDAMEALGYIFVERYRSSADAYNAVFKTFTAEEYARWDAKVRSGMSKLTQNPNGFFLMYEEAYIDKNCHNNDIENAYRTIYRFNQQIAYFMEFAMYNPDTFVLITADHETAGLDENWNATAFNLPPETGCDHSLQNVPVFAYGEGAEIFDGVTAENASIGRTFAHIMTEGNADDFGNPLYPIIGEEAGEDSTVPDGDIPEAPTTPVVQGTILQVVSPTRLTTKFGVYPGGDLNATFSDGNDGYCVTDGWYIRSGYSEHNKADGLTAVLIDINGTIKLGGLELTGHTSAGNDPTNFEIQAYVNGEWVTVYTVTSHPFASGPRTVKYTFDVVETSKVRILIHDYQGNGKCYIGEVTLFESTTGNVSNPINLAGTAGVLTDGDKSTCYTGDGEVINLMVDGQPTAISGFNLYYARGGNTAYPGSVTISVQRTPDGGFETIGLFVTNWDDGYPQDSVYVDFGETYVAYAIRIALDKRASVTEFELFQNVHEDKPVEPENPTDPSEPADPTDPSVPADPTDPSVPADPTDPSVPADPTDPSVPADPTDPSEPETTDPTEPADPTDPSEPEVTDPSEPEATKPADPDAPDKTGDITLTVLVTMMAISAIGGAVVISKKKDN